MKRGLREHSRWLGPTVGIAVVFVALHSSFVHRVNAADNNMNDAVAGNSVHVVNGGTANLPLRYVRRSGLLGRHAWLAQGD